MFQRSLDIALLLPGRCCPFRMFRTVIIAVLLVGVFAERARDKRAFVNGKKCGIEMLALRPRFPHPKEGRPPGLRIEPPQPIRPCPPFVDQQGTCWIGDVEIYEEMCIAMYGENAYNSLPRGYRGYDTTYN